MTVSQTTTGISGVRKACNDSGRRARAWALTMLFCVTCCLSIDSTAQGAVDTFQEGVAGYNDTQDTYLDEQFPDTSRGSASSVLVEYKPAQNETQQGLIRFDNIFGNGAGQIPFGSVINSASLTINVTNNSNAAAQIRLHCMLLSWLETATWNSMTGGIQTNDIEAMSAFDKVCARYDH